MFPGFILRKIFLPPSDVYPIASFWQLHTYIQYYPSAEKLIKTHINFQIIDYIKY